MPSIPVHLQGFLSSFCRNQDSDNYSKLHSKQNVWISCTVKCNILSVQNLSHCLMLLLLGACWLSCFHCLWLCLQHVTVYSRGTLIYCCSSFTAQSSNHREALLDKEGEISMLLEKLRMKEADISRMREEEAQRASFLQNAVMAYVQGSPLGTHSSRR